MSQRLNCTDVCLENLFLIVPFCFLQVLLFLQKEKEESPPEAQVKRREQRELETLWSLSSFKWKQLHRHTHPTPTPPCPLSLSSSPLTSSPSHFHIHSVPPSPHRALLFSFPVLPGYWRVKGTLQSYWLHNRLLIPLSTKNKCTYITKGALRKSKKNCNNETQIPWREYEKILFETVDVF